MGEVIIVTGGNRDKDQYKQLIQEHLVNPFVLGVDGGALWLANNDLQVDLAVGDFDTIGEAGLKELQKRKIPVQTYEAQKDETDTELAIRLALRRNPHHITIYGGIGHRFDHSLSNVHLLWKCKQLGVSCEIIDPWNHIRLVDQKITIHKEFTYISLIPFSPLVNGITLHGFKYPLTNATIRWGESIGVSNELLEPTGTIQVREGILLVIESKD